MKKIYASLMTLGLLVGFAQPTFGMEGQPGGEQQDGEPDIINFDGVGNIQGEDPARELADEQRAQLFGLLGEHVAVHQNYVVRNNRFYRSKKKEAEIKGFAVGATYGTFGLPILGGATLGYLATDNLFAIGALGVGCAYGVLSLSNYKKYKPAFFNDPQVGLDRLNFAERKKLSKTFYNAAQKADIATTTLGVAAGISYWLGGNTTERLKQFSLWLPAVFCATYATKCILNNMNKDVERNTGIKGALRRARRAQGLNN